MNKAALWLGVLGLVIGIGCTGVGKPGRGGRRGGDAQTPTEGGRAPKRGKMQADGTMLVELESSGLTRTVFLHVPDDYDASKSYPLVIVNHGGSDKGPDATVGSTMVGNWDNLFGEDLILLFPNGRHDGGDGRAWKGPGDDDPLRDVRFMTDLIDETASRYNVDRNKVFATGFSNGAGFTWWLMCNAADRFAGFGMVSQQMARPVMETCQPAAKRPIVYMTGTADPNWSGGEKVHGPPRETVAWVRQRWGCGDPAVEVVPDNGDRTTVTRERYTCAQGGFEFFEIEGGGHAWPKKDAPGRTPNGVERSRDIDGSQEMLDFWRASGVL